MAEKRLVIAGAISLIEELDRAQKEGREADVATFYKRAVDAYKDLEAEGLVKLLKEPYGSTIMRQQFEEAYQEAEPSTWVG